MSTTRQKITPCLWFNFNAEEAVAHYLGIFKRSRILETSRYGDAMPEFKGKVLLIRFELEGQELSRKVRLAERQVRTVLADRAACPRHPAH
jgi:predicted 3-demethylubiquinone-9 3-methyltransferase (glyoxalase superfamily)